MDEAERAERVRDRTAGGPFELDRFRTLYEVHARDALALAMMLTRDRALAEDIVQEAFVKVARRLADLRDPDAFPAYLRRTVVNLANSHYRRRRLERARIADLATEASAPAAASGEQGELWDALLQLPTRQRTALILRFGEDLAEREVAELMRTSEKAVRSLVGRGTEALRERLGGIDRWEL